MIFGITLIVLGIVGAPSVFLAKHAHAGELLSRLAPYQGWTGFIFCFWGLWNLLWAILGMGLLSVAPIWWITWLATSLVMALLGFLLGYGLISKWVFSKNEEAKAKGEKILKKLAPWQGTLGIASFALGVWAIIASFMFLAI